MDRCKFGVALKVFDVTPAVSPVESKQGGQCGNSTRPQPFRFLSNNHRTKVAVLVLSQLHTNE